MLSTTADRTQVTVRTAVPHDADRLRDLAALDSTRVPAGPLLVAEVDEEVVAAVSVTSKRAIADPFVPTADLVSLLKLRAAQFAVSADGHTSPRGVPHAEAVPA